MSYIYDIYTDIEALSVGGMRGGWGWKRLSPLSLFCKDRQKIDIQDASDINEEYMFYNSYCFIVCSIKK